MADSLALQEPGGASAPVQDPVRPLGVVDLEQAQQIFVQDGEEPPPVPELVKKAREKGYTKFRYRGQDFDFSSPLEAGIQQPEPMIQSQPGQAPAGESLEKDLDRARRVRIGKSFVRERGVLDLPQAQGDAFLGYLAASSGLPGYERGKAVDAILGLPEADRARVQDLVRDFNAYQQEQNLPLAPRLGLPFAGVSADERAQNMAAMAAVRPDDPARAIVDWTAAAAGAEARGLLAVADNEARRWEMERTLGTVVQTVGQPEGLAQIYHLLQSRQAIHDPSIVGIARLLVETRASAAGIEFDPVEEIPAYFYDPEIGKSGRPKVGPDDPVEKKKKIQALASLNKLLDETKDLTRRTLEAELGPEAAQITLDLYAQEEQLLKAYAQVFSELDPSKIGVSSERFDLSKVKNLQVLVEAMQRRAGTDDPMRRPELEGEVHAANWVMDALSWTSRRMGDAVEAFTGDYMPLMYVHPDGAVFQDPVESGAYALSLWRENPEAYEWIEDPRLQAQAPKTVYGSIVEQFAGMPSEGKKPLKPTAFVVDVESFAAHASYDKVRRTEDRMLSQVIADRMGATSAPDATLTRSVAGALSLGTEFLDPLFLVGAGSAKYAAVAARQKKVLEAVSKYAPALPDAAKAAGMMDAADLLKAAKMPYAQESAQQVAGTTQRVMLPNGKELAPALVPRFNALRDMLGSEDLAKSLTLGFQNDPSFFVKGMDTLLADPLARNRVHSWMLSAGLNVQTPEQAAAMLKAASPTLGFVLGHTATLSALDKAQIGYRGVLLGRAAMFEKARGLYLAKLPITPVLTQPITALLNPTLGGALRKFRQWADNNPGLASSKKKVISRIMDSRGLIRSGIHYDTRRLKAPELNTASEGGTVQANLGFYTLPPEMNAQLARLRQNTMAYATQVDDMVADVVTAHGILPVANDEYMKLAPYLLEMGDVPLDAATARSVAGHAAMRKRIAEIHALPTLEARMDKATEIMNSVTQAEADRVLSLLRSNAPYTDAAVGFYNHVGKLDEASGLLTTRRDYVNHIYYRTWGKGRLYQLNETAADGVVNRRALNAEKAKLSGFTMARSNDTLFDAMVAGYTPETDLMILLHTRASGHLMDQNWSKAVLGVVEDFGEFHPTQAALMNILSDANPGFSGIGYGKMVQKAAAEAEALGKGMEEAAALVRSERQVLARLETATLKAKSGNPPKALLLEAESARAAVEQHVAELGRRFHLNAEQMKHLGEHTTQGYQVVQNRMRHLRRILKEEPGNAAARAELTALDDQWGTYQSLREEFNAAGITDGEVSALTMELYGVPTLAHLDPGDGAALLNRMVSGKQAVVQVGGEARYLVSDLTDAARLYQETRKEQTYYAQFTQADERALAFYLSKAYLPVEQILALRAYGLGEKGMASMARVDGSMLAAMGQAWTKFIIRPWQKLATFWNPSLSFGRRNQLDAINKAFTYAGLSAASPAMWKEFNAWRAGELDALVTGTGRFVDARKAWDDAKPLLQSIAGRIDAMAVMQMGATAPDKTGAVLGERIRERITRYAAARNPSRMWSSYQNPFRSTPTGGRKMSALEAAAPFGPAASEIADNTLRLWTYFVELKAGRGTNDAINNAMTLARDWSNMTPFQQWITGGLPFTFINFYKQNTKAMLETMKRGDIGRMAIWPKLKEAIEADMPEELRAEWMNHLDSIMSEEGAWNTPLDLGSVEVFNPALTLTAGITDALGITKGPGMAQRARAALSQVQDIMPPAVQMAAGKEQYALKIPPDLAAQIYETLEDGDTTALGGLVRVKTSAGKPSLELNPIARQLVGLYGLNILGNSFVRHYDAFRHGDWRRWIIEEGGFSKFYPHQMQAVSKRRGDYARALNQKVLDSFWFFSDNGAGGLEIRRYLDLHPDERAFAESMLQGNAALTQALTDLNRILGAQSPRQGSTIVPENN